MRGNAVLKNHINHDFPKPFIHNVWSLNIMNHSADRPTGPIATLNTDAIAFGSGHRRIDCLKQLAYDCNLTNEEARNFGDLRATATWEKLLNSHGLEFEPKSEIITDIVAPANQESKHSINFFEWVDFGQLIAFSLASVGLAVLVLSLWPRINPLNLFPPVRINIQIGASK